MNRMSHWRQPRAAQHAKRVKDQGALWRQAERIDDSKRLGEKKDQPSPPSSTAMRTYTAAEIAAFMAERNKSDDPGKA